MADIDAKQVMDLRRRTGLGVMDCKKALAESGGDVEAAIAHLRKTSGLKAAKKTGRVAGEGVVLAAVSPDGARGVLVEVNSETDFVARDENFLDFARTVLEAASAGDTEDPAELMGGDLEQARASLVQKLGENIALRRIVRLRAEDGKIHAYTHHNRQLATLVSLRGGDGALGADIAMHITAMAPQVVDGADMPEEAVNREREIFAAQAGESGQNAEIVEKMVTGKIRKFLAENSLLGQAFIKDGKTRVADLLKKAGAQVEFFARAQVGEGVEKKESNFAAEVSEQLRGK